MKYDIQSPIWGGGKPQIGIADFRIKPDEIVEVEILYRKKGSNLLSYPGIYRMMGSKLLSYPTKVVAGGVRLHIAPLSDWEHEYKRDAVIPKPEIKEVQEPDIEQTKLF